MVTEFRVEEKNWKDVDNGGRKIDKHGDTCRKMEIKRLGWRERQR